MIVGGKPIRASRASAEWCLKGVDQCWSQKKRFIGPNEMPDATAAYDHLLKTGFLKPEDRVVLFNTGAGLKYTDVTAEAAGIQRPS